jgi:erythromycin esterase-like protein
MPSISKKRSLILTAIALFLSLGLRGQQAGGLDASSIHPIHGNDLTDPDQFTFLAPILKDVEVVSLAESIHMTHEFPLVRLGIVRYLNENLGFHVLVMEGSAPDVWVAQDRLLNSPRTVQDAAEAEGGFFGLWNTLEMRQLIEYEAASWHSSDPVYIMGYDIQPGNGHDSQGIEVFRQLIERLQAYAIPPAGFVSAQWMHDIEPLLSSEYHPSDHATVEMAIQTLEQWINRAAPEVEKRFPNVPHATALRLIPKNLRAVLQFREGLTQQNPQGYQDLRDINAASYVFQVKEAVDGHKLMLWAHVSHLHNDNERGPASVGGILHRSLGSHLYTIIPFAESGGAILIFPARNNEDLGYGRVRGERGDLAQLLSHLSKQNYFLDLRPLPGGPSANRVFWTSQPLQVESVQNSMILGRECDGIIWIRTVHAPDLTPFVLVVSLIHYRNLLIVAGIGLVLMIVLLPTYFLVRWRKQHRRHGFSA